MDIEELEKQLGLSKDEGENNKDNQELEDIINLLNSSEEEIINLSDNTDTFEGLSQEELDILMKQDDEISTDDIDTEVINDVSVYDNKTIDEEKVLEKLEDLEEESLTEEDEQENDETDNNLDDGIEEITEEEFKNLVEESKKEKNKNKKIEKSTVIIISLIVFLSALIVLTIIFFTISIKKANSIVIQNQIEKDNLISKYVPEDKNTVYFDMAQNIDGQTLVLEKMHINELNTTFYFKNKIEPMKYNIVLTDKDNNLYPMDLNFTKDGNDSQNTILRFGAIDGKIEEFILTFESISTGEKAVFNLNFDTKLETKKVKYINSDISNNFGDYSININYAQFSDSSSRIDYTIEPNEGVSYEIQQGALGETNYLTLKQGETHIQPLSNKPVTAVIDNKIIGRMDFKNIKENEENIVLNFDNIYKKYTLNKKVSLKDIRAGNLSYNFDKYKVFIEGMPNFGDTYVLVLHAEDTSINTENRPEDFNHIETKIDTEIIATSNTGVEVIISPTEIRSARYGTDIIFKLDTNQMGILNSLSADNIFINIKSILVNEKSVSIPINLNRAMEREIISHQIVEEQLKEAFASRLTNKVTGFSSEVLNNQNLTNEYATLPKGKKKNTISIISKNIEKDNLEAIVQEAIQIEEKGNIKVLYKTHKIKANNVEDKWTINYDEIIK
ncbi:hypothetical protein [[Clostridium] colinum]|uniref:hypothetical protein n=1 Tax=[Clostridium] colinum TaxID=36835 RepID=UPI002023C780|nr:hypothetical protein [[Clostridium] colinum]